MMFCFLALAIVAEEGIDNRGAAHELRRRVLPHLIAWMTLISDLLL
jgi:hypothetical protein